MFSVPVWSLNGFDVQKKWVYLNLCPQLYHKSPGFDLTDPNMHQVDNTYNCLHDVHLRKYFRKPKRRQRLIQDGYITADEKVCYFKN